MTIKNIYEALGALENGEKMIEVVKQELSNIRQESAQRRVEKNDILNALGLINSNDVNNDILNIKNTLDTIKNNGINPNTVAEQLKNLTEQVSTLTKKSEEAEQKSIEEYNKRIEQMKINKALEILNLNNANNPAVVSKLILDNLEYDKDKNVIKYVVNGENKTVEDGIKAFLSDNPYLVKNTIQQGSNSAPHDNDGYKQYTREQINNMTTEEINKNWNDIQNSLNNL